MASRIVWIAVIGCSTLALLPGVATAHDVRWDTKWRGSVYNAKKPGGEPWRIRIRTWVNSPERSACAHQRTVTLWKRSHLSPMDELIGSAVTNRKGLAFMSFPSFERGKYTLAAERRILQESPDHMHVCKAPRLLPFKFP